MRWLIPILLAFTLLPFVLLGKLSDSEYYIQVKHFSDGVNNRTIQQVLAKDWSQEGDSIMNFGFSDQSHWFYFEIPPQQIQQGLPLMIEVDFPTIDNLAFFVVNDDNEVTRRIETGAALPFSSRPVWSENFVFPVAPLRDGGRIFINAKTSNALQMPILVYTEKEFYEKEEWSLLLWGGYYGVMLIMMVYSLMNGVIMKELLFFYYSAYVLSTALIVSALNGHGFAYLWPNTPELNNVSIAVFTCLATAFGTAFAMKFLRVNELHRYYSLAGGFVILVSGVVVLLSAVTLNDYSLEATMVAMLFAIVTLAFAFSAIMAKYYLGWYFLAGWTVFLLSIGIFSLNILGVLPSNILTYHSKEVGSVIEIILFSLGLSAIYSKEKQERDRVHKALDLMKERLKNRVNIVNDKSGFLEIPQLSKHLQDIRGMDKRIHAQMGRLLVVSVMVIDKVTQRPDYIALGDCLRSLFNSRITVFPFKSSSEGLKGDVTVLLFPLHNKFEAEGIIERVEGWSYSLGEHYDLHFGYAISHLTEKYDVNYIEESFHYLEEAVQKKSVSYSIDDTLSFIHRGSVA